MRFYVPRGSRTPTIGQLSLSPGAWPKTRRRCRSFNEPQEEERSRIARELHDDISQQLTVLTIDLKLLGQSEPGDTEAAAAEALKRAEDIGTSVHDLSHRLHPARLRVLGLVEAVNGLKRELSHPDATITFVHQGIPPTLAPELTLCLFRIVQEALQNAFKHGKARHVSVDLTGASDGIDLTIVDDGVGFDVDVAWRKGLGLISVNERVEAIGGTFTLRSSPGRGPGWQCACRSPSRRTRRRSRSEVCLLPSVEA